MLIALVLGSSPRMRGTLTLPLGARDNPRIIPAHAGNSRPCRSCHPHTADHPRACGELFPALIAVSTSDGSSPRMRGTRSCYMARSGLWRIIPAHAGNSSPAAARSSRSADHPRACGELLSRLRMRPSSSGSSPRMRGTPVHGLPLARRDRIIPAHAGNSSARSSAGSGTADHPRACGELLLRVVQNGLEYGSSPRMRGTRRCGALCGEVLRIIPAHAGNSEKRFMFEMTISGSSPRMRGTHPRCRSAWPSPRIIPAHAGNSVGRSPWRRTHPDHPRACGELCDPSRH